MRGHFFYSERQVVGGDGNLTTSRVVNWKGGTGNVWNEGNDKWEKLSTLQEAIRLSRVNTAKLLVPSGLDDPLFSLRANCETEETLINDYECELVELCGVGGAKRIWVDKSQLIIRRIDFVPEDSSDSWLRFEINAIYFH